MYNLGVRTLYHRLTDMPFHRRWACLGGASPTEVPVDQLFYSHGTISSVSLAVHSRTGATRRDGMESVL